MPVRSILALSLALGVPLLGGCVQEPYIKSEKDSGAMMNAAEADNQAGRRRAIETLKDPPLPTATVTPSTTAIPSKVKP